MDSHILLHSSDLFFPLADLHPYVGVHFAEDLSVPLEVCFDNSNIQPATELVGIDDLQLNDS